MQKIQLIEKKSESVNVGDSVKIEISQKISVDNSLATKKEKLWVEIVEVSNSVPKTFRGKIDSDPSFLVGVNFGDAVSFNMESILDVLKK